MWMRMRDVEIQIAHIRVRAFCIEADPFKIRADAGRKSNSPSHVNPHTEILLKRRTKTKSQLKRIAFVRTVKGLLTVQTKLVIKLHSSLHSPNSFISLFHIYKIFSKLLKLLKFYLRF